MNLKIDVPKTSKRQIKRLTDVTVEYQPDSLFLTIPLEITAIVLSYCTIDHIKSLSPLCKQMYLIMDRFVERKLYQQTLNSLSDPKEKKELSAWYKHQLKQRAFSLNDVDFIIEYFGGSPSASQVREFCNVNRMSYIFRAYDEKALKNIRDHDADAILKYFIEVMEGPDSNEMDKWNFARSNDFQSFLFNLLRAFEDDLTDTKKRAEFEKLHIFDLFMKLMSKYSHIVVRLLIKIPPGEITKVMPYRILRALLVTNSKYPMDMTSKMSRDELGAPLIYYLTPLEACCYAGEPALFNIISTVTPVILSAGYFTAVVCGNSNPQGRFQLFDELLEKGVDINAKVNPLLKSDKKPWVETLLGFFCFCYNKPDFDIFIEWLMIHKARFSDKELTAIQKDPDITIKVKLILEMIKIYDKVDYNPFSSPPISWEPKIPTDYREFYSNCYLNLQNDFKFAARVGNDRYCGKWEKSKEIPNLIICNATTEELVQLRGSYEGHIEYEVSLSIEYYAFRSFGGHEIVVRGDEWKLWANRCSVPSYEDMKSIFIPKNAFN